MYKKRLRDAYISEPTEHEILYHIKNQDIYQYGNQKSPEKIEYEKIQRGKRLRTIYVKEAQRRRSDWDKFEGVGSSQLQVRKTSRSLARALQLLLDHARAMGKPMG